MFPFRTVEIAFRRFQTRREPRALAMVFDRTAPELLALARHLAPPGTEACDLVQATFVTAIEAADSHRTGERVLPWLCGVLANHARMARRRQRRPIDASRLRHAVTDAGLEAEAGELRAELRAAIDRLPEVYRPVLRLVFEHGLQAQEVAHTLERPAGTVRAQVTRGLELLRRTLPASLAGGVAVTAVAGRGLAAVRQSVLGKAGGTGVGAVSPLFLGGLIVLHHKLFAAGAAALFAVFGMFWLLQEPPPVGPQTSTETRTTAAVATGTIEPHALASERQRVAAAPEPSTADTPQATASPAPTGGGVSVLVRDELGQPMRGVRVAVHPFSALQDLGRRMDYVATDARGEARFADLAADDWAIDIDRQGTAGVVHAVPTKWVEQKVTLAAGVRVTGRVVDARGAPVGGASLVLHGSRACAIEVARSDALGVFAIEHLAPGLELQARAPRREASLVHPVRGAGGSTVAMELVLGDAARTVRGVVRGPDGRGNGDAVVAILPANVQVAPRYDASAPQVRATWLRTAADGSFACDEVGTGPQVVFARALPFAPAWNEVDTTTGDAVVEVRLPRGAAVEGRVDRGMAPVAGATVLTWPLDETPIGYLQNLFGMRHVQTAADGTFRIDGLVPGEHSLRLMQQTTMLRQQTLAFDDGATVTWNVDLDATAKLRIAVACAAPLDGLRLVALVRNNPMRDGEPPALVPIQRDGTGELPAPRDSDVDVILTMMPGGRNILQLAAVTNVPAGQTQVAFELRPEQLPRRCITGRLVDAARAPLAGGIVTASRIAADGLVVRVEATTDADGSFRLGPLPAGDYMLLDNVDTAPVLVGQATVTAERDEPLGDLVVDGSGR